MHKEETVITSKCILVGQHRGTATECHNRQVNSGQQFVNISGHVIQLPTPVVMFYSEINKLESSSLVNIISITNSHNVHSTRSS